MLVMGLPPNAGNRVVVKRERAVLIVIGARPFFTSLRQPLFGKGFERVGTRRAARLCAPLPDQS